MKLVLLTVILFFNVSTVFADLSDKEKIQETISQQISSFQPRYGCAGPMITIMIFQSKPILL